jgi:hypothetical protein
MTNEFRRAQQLSREVPLRTLFLNTNFQMLLFIFSPFICSVIIILNKASNASYFAGRYTEIPLKEIDKIKFKNKQTTWNNQPSLCREIKKMAKL